MQVLGLCTSQGERVHMGADHQQQVARNLVGS